MTRVTHIQPNEATGGRPPVNCCVLHSQILQKSLIGVPCSVFNQLQRSVFGVQCSVFSHTHNSNPEPNWYIYHSDHLGSSAFLTDASGDPTQHLQYMPFGETFVEQRSITSYYTPYTFSAKERDTETGYSYFGARYYDADISVWLSVDPMSDEHADYNPYAYVYNMPTNLIDPFGLDTFQINVQNRKINTIPVEGSTSHTFVVTNGSKTTTTTLEANDKGLVKFPGSGNGFGRYGTEDQGGDHYLKPIAAAALFGLTTEMSNQIPGFNVQFGDMSAADGTAPGGNHKTHGGPKGYSGVCIDFRYLDIHGKSFQGNSDNPKFDVWTNGRFLQIAGHWGFTKNYISNQKNVWTFKMTIGPRNNIRTIYYPVKVNGTQIGGHHHHGHLTYIGK
jgi:RHS repeat-associated protein